MNLSDEAAGNVAGPEAGGGGKAEPARWDIEWIMALLPHRYPMLLVDRVLENVPRQRIVAIKNVTINEPFFAGHFPGRPVMPGVLVIEAMAQAGGLLLLQEVPDRASKLLYFTGIYEARFRRPVVPGDQLRFEVDVVRYRAVHAKLAAKALVDGQVAAEAVLSSVMVER
jgi:3-hydroxyacyl-[acyl-carrier-protein] dehydratase